MPTLPNDTTGSFPYRPLPPEVKRMILQEAVSDSVLSLARTEMVCRQNDPQRLRLVSQETKRLADTILRPIVICYQVLLPGQPRCIWTSGEMPALRLFYREKAKENERLPVTLPFTKVIAISNTLVADFHNDLGFVDPLAYLDGGVAEVLARHQWTTSDLPKVADLNVWQQIKELTLVIESNSRVDYLPQIYRLEPVPKLRLPEYHVKWNTSYRPDHRMGAWFGFRLFKGTGRIEFTRLTWADVQGAADEAKIYPASPSHHTTARWDIEANLVCCVSWIGEDEEVTDEPHHKWVCINEFPDTQHSAWMSGVRNLWKITDHWVETKRHTLCETTLANSDAGSSAITETQPSLSISST